MRVQCTHLLHQVFFLKVLVHQLIQTIGRQCGAHGLSVCHRNPTLWHHTVIILDKLKSPQVLDEPFPRLLRQLLGVLLGLLLDVLDMASFSFESSCKLSLALCLLGESSCQHLLLRSFCCSGHLLRLLPLFCLPSCLAKSLKTRVRRISARHVGMHERNEYGWWLQW